MTKRHLLVAGALGVPATLASLWFAWLPGKIAREVESRARTRGWEVSVGDVWPGLMGVDLESVRAQRPGVDANIDRVELDAGPLSLAWSGTDAVEEVGVVGGSVSLNRELLAGVGEAEDEVEPPRGSSRRVRLASVAISVDDDDGTLAEAILSGMVESDSLELVGERCRLGEAPSHQVTADRVAIEGRHSDVGWQLASVKVEGAELHIAPSEGAAHESVTDGEEAPEGPLATRERVERLFGGREPRSRESDAPESSDGTDEAPEEAPEDSSAPAEDAEGGALVRGGALLERIAAGATFELVGMDVVRGTSGEPEAVLRDLGASVTREEEVLHIEATAEGSGGSLQSDLRVGWDPPRLEGSFGAERLPFDVLVPFLPDLPWHRPEDGRISVDVTLDAPSPEQVDVNGALVVAGLSFEHPRLSATPIREVSFEARGSATLRPLEGRLTYEDVVVTAGRAEAHLSGAVVADEGIQMVSFHGRLPPTRCDDAVDAIPQDLLAESSGFSWEGSLSGRIDLEVDRSDLDATTLDIDLTDGCTFETVPAVADLRRVRTTFVHRVQEPDGTVFEMSTGPGTPSWTSLIGVSPFVVHAIVGHEDAGFFGHHGFAVYAIRDALKRNLREGRYVMGASTITMQLAKNLFLRREKTLARKVQEVLLTWWLESALSKAEILELYLNVIEYGPAVYGITQASQHYFGRHPRELTPAESAYLACILPNPKGLQASYEQGSLTAAMRNRLTRFLRHLNDRGRIDEEALAYGIAELESFRFHVEGETPEPRDLPPGAGPLPVATATSARTPVDEWGEYESSDEGWTDTDWEPMDSDG